MSDLFFQNTEERLEKELQGCLQLLHWSQIRKREQITIKIKTAQVMKRNRAVTKLSGRDIINLHDRFSSLLGRSNDLYCPKTTLLEHKQKH